MATEVRRNNCSFDSLLEPEEPAVLPELTGFQSDSKNSAAAIGSKRISFCSQADSSLSEEESETELTTFHCHQSLEVPIQKSLKKKSSKLLNGYHKPSESNGIPHANIVTDGKFQLVLFVLSIWSFHLLLIFSWTN